MHRASPRILQHWNLGSPSTPAVVGTHPVRVGNNTSHNRNPTVPTTRITSCPLQHNCTQLIACNWWVLKEVQHCVMILSRTGSCVASYTPLERLGNHRLGKNITVNYNLPPHRIPFLPPPQDTGFLIWQGGLSLSSNIRCRGLTVSGGEPPQKWTQPHNLKCF